VDGGNTAAAGAMAQAWRAFDWATDVLFPEDAAFAALNRVDVAVAAAEVDVAAIGERLAQHRVGHVALPEACAGGRCHTDHRTDRLRRALADLAVAQTEVNVVAIDRWRAPHRQFGVDSPHRLAGVEVEAEHRGRLVGAAGAAADVDALADDR